MNVYKMAVDHLNEGDPPKSYREAAELWIKINPNKHIPVFQQMVKAAKEAADIPHFYDHRVKNDVDMSQNLAMKMPASLLRFLEQYDPDVLTSDTKFKKLKRQLPMLCVEYKSFTV